MTPDRGSVWKRFGEPSDQEGSVNEPRTRDEHGFTWNERWIYREGERVTRVVLWNRYDLVAVLRVEPDGREVPEAIA